MVHLYIELFLGNKNGDKHTLSRSLSGIKCLSGFVVEKDGIMRQIWASVNPNPHFPDQAPEK